MSAHTQVRRPSCPAPGDECHGVKIQLASNITQVCPFFSKQLPPPKGRAEFPHDPNQTLRYMSACCMPTTLLIQLHFYLYQQPHEADIITLILQMRNIKH